MGLRAEVVDLVGLDLLDDVDEGRGVGEVAVVEDEVRVGLVRVLVEVVDAGGIEERRTAFDAMDFVALGEEELGEVGAVLAGDAGDESFLQDGMLRMVRIL